LIATRWHAHGNRNSIYPDTSRPRYFHAAHTDMAEVWEQGAGDCYSLIARVSLIYKRHARLVHSKSDIIFRMRVKPVILETWNIDLLSRLVLASCSPLAFLTSRILAA
jgi:hypothetical protein